MDKVRACVYGDVIKLNKGKDVRGGEVGKMCNMQYAVAETGSIDFWFQYKA